MNRLLVSLRERERERERLFVSLIYLVVFLSVLLAVCFPAAGEGSRDYNAIDNSARTQLSGVTTHYVYLKQGENLYIGSSTTRNTDYDVYLIAPDGTRSTYDIEQNGVGHIVNRTQELAGPKPINSSGYNPIVYTASVEGIYTVRFQNNPNYTEHSYCNILNKDDWNSLSCGYTFAWDITVSSANGNRINGRVFSPVLRLGAQTNSSIGRVEEVDAVTTSVYILTDNGYQYKFTMRDVYPWVHYLNFSNMGIMVNNHSAYTSAHRDSPGYSYFNRADFIRQSNGGVMYRIFYNKPDAALLQYLGLPADGSPIIPEISNFKFQSNSNLTNKEYGGEGGTFSFNSSSNNGKYTFTLSFSNGKNIIKSGNLSSTVSIPWDGKDSEGNIVGASEITAKIDLMLGENHFVINDFEQIDTGITIQRLNGNLSNPYRIFYNHKPQEVDGYPNFMDTICDRSLAGNDCQPGSTTKNYASLSGWTVDANDTSIQYLYGNLDNSNGINSSSGVSRTANFFSDYKLLDFWAYDDSVKPASISVTIISDEKISLVVNKLWEDESDRDGVRPSTISVKLLQNEIEYDTAAITGSAGNTWTYTFRNLPKYNTDGQLFEYSVEEVVE